jgi:signal transduction histidine kinase
MAGDGLILRVTDDGIGFGKRRSTKGSGLAIMEYRARISGGDLKIGAAQGGGTEVLCKIRRKILEDEVAVA